MVDSSKKTNSVLIACGGTGGHLFPGIAVAQEVANRGGKPLLLISEKAIDQTASDDYPELTFVPLPAVAMPKLLSLKFPVFIWRFLRSLSSCREIMRRYEITSVLGMGGFTSLAPIMAGKRSKIPSLVHDSNALPGKANRLAARFCEQVFVGMEAASKHFGSYPTSLVGTPVRDAILDMRPVSDEAKRAARASFDLDPELPTVLVTGGSQGARAVNDAMMDALKALPDDALQVLWITGPNEHERVAGAMESVAQRVKVIAFCSRMEDALIAADVAVARAGASTLTEFSAIGLPAILVPYPHAADDHQTHNAQHFVDHRAALMFQESELSEGTLADALTMLISDPEKRKEMAAAMAALFQESPAKTIANRVMHAS